MPAPRTQEQPTMQKDVRLRPGALPSPSATRPDADPQATAKIGQQQPPDAESLQRMTVYVCEQCNGTGQLPQGQRCPCREEDDTAAERRAGMRLEPPREKANDGD